MGAEEWRPVAGYEGLYEVSTLGQVRSVDRQVLGRNGKTYRFKGKLLKGAVSDNGYRVVHLGHHTQRTVHTLVLEAFAGTRPSPRMQGCHRNGDKSNNTLENLRWGTPSENNFDKVKHGVHTQASQEACKRGHLLTEPNLTRSRKRAHWRGCLACQRAHSTVRDARERNRVELDLQVESDRHYAKIMAAA